MQNFGVTIKEHYGTVMVFSGVVNSLPSFCLKKFSAFRTFYLEFIYDSTLVLSPL